MTRACEARGDFVFYSPDMALPPELENRSVLPTAEANATLGRVADHDLPAQRLKSGIKQFVPPILWEAVRKLRPQE